MASSAWVQDSNLYLPQIHFKPDCVLIALLRSRAKPVRSNLPAPPAEAGKISGRHYGTIDVGIT